MQLTPKAFDLLMILLESAGQTVTVDRLMSSLWPDNEEANDATLRQHVLMVRRALGDRIRDPRYVVTDYGKGYRFVGAVTSGPSFLTQTLVEELCTAAAEFRAARSGTSLRRALDLYARALTIDAVSAAALAGAALCRCLIADNLRDLPKPLLETARAQATEALSIDPNNVDALLACAKVRLAYDRDFTGALATAQRALSLEPANRLALGLRAWTLILDRQFAQLLSVLESPRPELNGSDFAHLYRGLALLYQRDYTAATIELSAACAERPHAWFARTKLGQALFLSGNVARAVSEFDAVRLSTYDPLAEDEVDARFLAEGYALYARFRSGDTTNAENALERLRRLSERQFVPAMCFALAEIGRRDEPQALHYLRVSEENCECWYAQFHIEPFVDDVRAQTQSPRHWLGGFAT
ncbi:MAG: winged helix-turn-helix domain-containing protein [Candidatus Eremiobacteraeota bacterium]|nr:winged helix-turn-helix domain-containing protein [Candidatus Eremiobacteraeota bacterium]MBV8371662.1 winged helix-turn-helix domain-containing protein [Candidatus Eremiobacteraeota bacterium]